MAVVIGVDLYRKLYWQIYYSSRSNKMAISTNYDYFINLALEKRNMFF